MQVAGQENTCCIAKAAVVVPEGLHRFPLEAGLSPAMTECMAQACQALHVQGCVT